MGLLIGPGQLDKERIREPGLKIRSQDMSRRGSAQGPLGKSSFKKTLDIALGSGSCYVFFLSFFPRLTSYSYFYLNGTSLYGIYAPNHAGLCEPLFLVGLTRRSEPMFAF